MKKNKKIILIIGLSVLGAIVGGLFGKWLASEFGTPKESPYTTLTLSEDLCQFMFRCEPNEFSLDNQYLPQHGKNFCKKYGVDSNNNLKIVMSDFQCEEWEGYYDYLTSFHNTDKNDSSAILHYGEVILSDDMYTVTLYTFSRGLSFNAQGGEEAVKKCIAHHLINGVEPQNIVINFVVRDAGNDNIVYKATCPPDDISFENWIYDIELSSHKEYLKGLGQETQNNSSVTTSE